MPIIKRSWRLLFFFLIFNNMSAQFIVKRVRFLPYLTLHFTYSEPILDQVYNRKVRIATGTNLWLNVNWLLKKQTSLSTKFTIPGKYLTPYIFPSSSHYIFHIYFVYFLHFLCNVISCVFLLLFSFYLN